MPDARYFLCQSREYWRSSWATRRNQFQLCVKLSGRCHVLNEPVAAAGLQRLLTLVSTGFIDCRLASIEGLCSGKIALHVRLRTALSRIRFSNGNDALGSQTFYIPLRQDTSRVLSGVNALFWTYFIGGKVSLGLKY